MISQSMIVNFQRSQNKSFDSRPHQKRGADCFCVASDALMTAGKF